MMMKSLVQTVALTTALIVPAVSFAQSNGPVTRAQVRAEIVQLEQAGWNPATGDDINYPADLQAAEAKVAAMNAHTSGYGGTQTGTSSAGNPSLSKAD